MNKGNSFRRLPYLTEVAPSFFPDTEIDYHPVCKEPFYLYVDEFCNFCKSIKKGLLESVNASSQKLYLLTPWGGRKEFNVKWRVIALQRVKIVVFKALVSLICNRLIEEVPCVRGWRGSHSLFHGAYRQFEFTDCLQAFIVGLSIYLDETHFRVEPTVLHHCEVILNDSRKKTLTLFPLLSEGYLHLVCPLIVEVVV